MKILYQAFCVALVAMSVLSCDDEPIDFSLRENEPEPVVDSLVGNWVLTDAQLMDTTASYDIAGTPVTKEVSGESGNYELNLSFFEDNTTDFTGSFVQTFELNLGLSNSAEAVAINADDIFTQGAWSRKPGVLQISSDTETQEIEVLELSGDTLELRVVNSQMQSIQGIPVTLEATYILSFERERI